MTSISTAPCAFNTASAAAYLTLSNSDISGCSTAIRTPASEALASGAAKSCAYLAVPLVAGSAGSTPIIPLNSTAASRTLRAIGPGVSWLWLIGTTCVRLIMPSVGFNPTSPFIEDGHTTDPSVSVPTAAAAKLAATAAPDPLEDPHEVRSSA